jgi:hypothetical protein
MGRRGYDPNRFPTRRPQPEAEAAYINSEVTQMRAELEAVKNSEQDNGRANSSIIKRLEKAVLAQEEALKAKLDAPADPGISFEETGIDYLVVDELHDYKNLRTPSNIPGAAIQGSARASDLHMKTEFLRQREGRRVITGATATPIANSVTEMYVMQRYLRPDLLQATGIQDFNTWAATFGQVVEEMELSVAGGDRFKFKSRFAKFQNVPELLKMFHTFADVKTTEDLKLSVPDLARREGDGLRRPNMLAVEPSPELRDYIQDIGKRVDAIQQRLVDSEEDNMLKVSSDGRKAALEMRLVGPRCSSTGPPKSAPPQTCWPASTKNTRTASTPIRKPANRTRCPERSSWSSVTSAHPLTGGTSTANSKTSCAAVAYPNTRSGSSTRPGTTPKRPALRCRSLRTNRRTHGLDLQNGRRNQHPKTCRAPSGHGRALAPLRRRTTSRPHPAPM